MAVTGTMVHVKSDGIPKLRGYLPLVKQTRMLSFQQLLRSQICFEEVFFHLLGVIHIDDALGLLFGGSCLAAPLGTFNEHGTFTSEFSRKDRVGYSGFVCIHILCLWMQRYKKPEIVEKFFRKLLEIKTDK